VEKPLADGTRPRLRGSFVVYVPSATGQLTAVSRLRPFICNLDLCSAPHSKSARRLLPATEYYICARARLQAQFIHHRSHISRSSILSQLHLLLPLRRRSAQLSSNRRYVNHATIFSSATANRWTLALSSVSSPSVLNCSCLAFLESSAWSSGVVVKLQR
jgi:hypothetical protein